MSRIEAIVSDFGGVLTSPLLDSFAAFQDSSGISLEQLGTAMAAVAARDAANPLFELETGRMSEAGFLKALSDQLSRQLERPVELHGFGERYFDNLHPNEPMIDYMRELRGRGYRMAICTNNVREWEPLWRAKLPVDEIFDVVVDSAFVGTRKPEPRIYEITLERLGVAAPAAVLLDDIEVNCTAARELGLEAVWFRSTDQAIAELEAAAAASRGQLSTPSRSQQYSSRHSRASSVQRSWDSHGSTVSSASSSPTPCLERLLPAEARRDLERLAAVLAQRREDVDQELLVGNRMADLERCVPGGQHREIVLVQVGDRLGVVGRELRLGDLVHPRLDDLAEDLATRLAANGIGDHPDGVLRLDEAEWHRGSPLGDRTSRKLGIAPDVTARPRAARDPLLAGRTRRRARRGMDRQQQRRPWRLLKVEVPGQV